VGVTTYTVTFDKQDGSATTSTSVPAGSTVARPADPTRTNYIFGGWYKDEACTTAWNFDTDVVTGNITLYAKWTTASVTGAVETWRSASLQIYPNPFTDAVRIIGAGAVETGSVTSVQIRIINAAGVVVHTQIITGNDETIRLEHLPAGVYFFRLEKDGKAETVKVVRVW